MRVDPADGCRPGDVPAGIACTTAGEDVDGLHRRR